MMKATQVTKSGSTIAEQVGKLLVDDMKADPVLKESVFTEDNDMSNSADFYTTQLASAIYYKSYDKFQQYFDMVWNLTPADVGSMDGAGAYKIPKLISATAAKIDGGEVVDYINDNKDSVTLETDTYAIGTRINRRLLKRAGKGIIARLLTVASDAVLRAVCTDLINGMISAAVDANTVTGEISYAKVEESKRLIKASTDSNSQKFGLMPDFIGFTETGWEKYITDTTIVAMVGYGQRNVPGAKLDNDYQVVQGLKVTDIALATGTKDAKTVRAIVVDSMNFMCFLKETEMETYDGRLPGTAGDEEVIHAMDAGYIVMNTAGGSVITTA